MLVLYRLFDAKFNLFLWAVKGEPPPDPETAGIGSPRDWIILNTAEKNNLTWSKETHPGKLIFTWTDKSDAAWMWPDLWRHTLVWFSTAELQSVDTYVTVIHFFCESRFCSLGFFSNYWNQIDFFFGNRCSVSILHSALYTRGLKTVETAAVKRLSRALKTF